jgi:hypothetical protein
MECRSAYTTADLTASPKIEAARMISVKLIDMNSSSPLKTGEGRLRQSPWI